MEAHATNAAPSPTPPTSPGDHGGPPGPSGEWTRFDTVLVAAAAAVVVVVVGLVVLGAVSIVRSANHPRDTTPAQATLGRAVIAATRELPAADLEWRILDHLSVHGRFHFG